jgi:hypothetical protein
MRYRYQLAQLNALRQMVKLYRLSLLTLLYYIVIKKESQHTRVTLQREAGGRVTLWGSPWPLSGGKGLGQSLHV